MKYIIELIWNREIHWVTYGGIYDDMEKAKKVADEVLYMGDGARVKKVRVVDDEDIVHYKKG